MNSAAAMINTTAAPKSNWHFAASEISNCRNRSNITADSTAPPGNPRIPYQRVGYFVVDCTPTHTDTDNRIPPTSHKPKEAPMRPTLCLGLTLLASAVSAQPAFTVIAKTGQSAPGTS